MKVAGDLFTPIDHAIIRAAVRELPGLLGAVIEMRFWRHMEFVEIADELGLSIRTVEFAMIQAVRRLREICLKHPAFSRSKYDALKMFESHSVA
jgi:DNA-directed RNA polymerase specialized sigma24 family protein